MRVLALLLAGLGIASAFVVQSGKFVAMNPDVAPNFIHSTFSCPRPLDQGYGPPIPDGAEDGVRMM